MGSDESPGYECRVRLPDGSVEEAVISVGEAAAVLKAGLAAPESIHAVDAENFGS